MSELVFSWAEDAGGKMVHVDSVDNGLGCGCFCPCCHEPLQARHGDVRAHGFAHHSESRRANMKICYMVTMYKLAEQIVMQGKKLMVPSYYGIIKKQTLEFAEVVVDDKYERADKQPDVSATTADGEQYLIEFTFAYKVQHKEKVDYKRMNCIEIDLVSQTLETLHDFLLYSGEGRRWLNNQSYFDRIESIYYNIGMPVKAVNENDCANCIIKDDCCGVRYKGKSHPVMIENSGNVFRVCKIQEYEYLKKKKEEERLNYLRVQKSEGLQQFSEVQRNEENGCCVGWSEEFAMTSRQYEEAEYIEDSIMCPELRTCFMCRSNLDWMCRNDGYAHCGPYLSMGVPKNTPPEIAKICRGFRAKQKKE